MTKNFAGLLALGSISILFTSITALRAADMQERTHTAIELLGEKQRSDEPIPQDLLDHAKGVAIFNVTKAGLGVGGQGGEGIVLVRLGDMTTHSWTAPSAFNLSGASIGAQIGFTNIQYIVVLNTDDAVRHFTTSGKLDWNATATGTSGSDTATEKATTSDLEHRDVVIYKETGGIFGGATLGGTSVERKDAINQQAYGDDVLSKNILNGNVHALKSADRLFVLLDGKK